MPLITASRFFVSFLLILFSFFSKAAFITGTISDEKKDPIPYANVYLQPSLKGTTTNAEGYYKLETLPGTYTIVFKYLGYKTQTKEITISDKDVILNISLLSESYMLNGITINAGGEDPAYAIIRNAINKRKFYLNQVDGYNCNVYIKGVQKLTKYPDKFMGNVVDFGGQVDSITGIFYLSESVSKFSFKKPGKIKEEMISSRMSGSSKSFSYNQASDMLFNFYENNVMGKAIGERGYISPIAESALFYYRYKLEGSSVENDVLIHKITVTPRRKFDPAFRGVIYIAEGSWRIQSMDVYLTRESGLEFLDTLRVRQTYLPVNNADIWMPVNNRFDFSFKILGFTGGGNYVGYFSNFEINPAFAKKTFSNEILKVEADANKKDSTYWESIRPIPLTLEEKVDYIKKDSLAVVRTTEQYNDSMDHIRNKFSVTSYLLSGYSYRKGFKKTELSFESLFRTVHYNTVEGWCISLNNNWEKRFEDKRRLELNSSLRYGFSNTHFNANSGFKYLYNRLHESFYTVNGGTSVKQINESAPITPFLNSLYTLIGEKNYIKLFEKRFISAAYSREWFNGFTGMLSGEFAQRLPLQNTSFTHWKNVSGREYTSNDPQNPFDDLPAFEKNNALLFGVNINYVICKKYISRPDVKIATESKFPEIQFEIKQAVAGMFNSKADFTKLKAGLSHSIDFGILGYLDYRAACTWFTSINKIYFTDYTHFNGNQTWFSNFEPETFNALEYYSYSTTKGALAIHGEYHFNHFISNKIPLFRKLKLSEIASVHYLSVKGLPSYTEVAIGLEKFGIIRADFYSSFTGNSKPSYGFRFGLRIF